MLRVLTLATLFPDASRPSFGIFVARQTAALAARSGVEVHVVAPRGIPPLLGRHARYRELAALPAEETWGGVPVARPRFVTLPGRLARHNAALLARALLPGLKALRERFAFDVIDAEFFWPDGPAAIRLGRALGVPVSIKARGADIHHWGHARGIGRQMRAAGGAAGGMLAVSGALRDDMIALGMPAERIRVHHTGVDLAAFRPVADRTAAKAALGITGPLLVTVGHLIPRKGQRHAIDAAALLPDAMLLLAGEGPDRAVLTAQIAALGLGERVRLLGTQPHGALPALLAAADALVLPTASEGLANVWIEALACGTPVVTTPVGGAAEAIDRPAAGRLVPRDPAAIAAALRAILAAPPAAADVRGAAERFTWEANGAALEAHLRRVVERGAAGRSESSDGLSR